MEKEMKIPFKYKRYLSRRNIIIVALLVMLTTAGTKTISINFSTTINTVGSNGSLRDTNGNDGSTNVTAGDIDSEGGTGIGYMPSR